MVSGATPLPPSRQDLESLLKSSCEAFIQAAAHLLVGRVADSLLGASPPRPAVWDAFVGPATAQLEATVAALPGLLLALRRRVSLYMGSGVTAGILFKPVLDSCGHVLASLRRRAEELAEQQQQGLQPEPAAAAAAAAEGGPDARAEAQGAATASASGLDRIEALCDEALRLLLLSDGLAADAAGPGFGYDDHVLTLRQPHPPQLVQQLHTPPQEALGAAPE